MLTLKAGRPSGRMCDGVSRRDFFKVGGLALGGLTLEGLLRNRALAGTAARSAKSVIMVFLPGGPSHIDMYDLKPDAPVEIRGEFQPTATNVPGVNVCSLMPLHTQIADKYAVVNGVQTLDTHSAWVVMTGYGEKEMRPVFGSYVSRIRGSTVGGLPTYVALGGENGADPREPGFLGAAHRPFTPGGPGLDSMGRPRELTVDRFDDRRALLTQLDRFRREVDVRSSLAGHDGFTRQALEMIASEKARAAFDVSKEPAAVREKFGVAGRLLMARRLVEAGVPVVTLSVGGTIVPGGDWDTHAGDDQKKETNFGNLRRKLPVYDRAIHALVTDLYERGLDKDVLVVVWGEFGRTPRVNKTGGRDHWAPAGSVLFAGGGMRMGQVIGNTSPRAERSIGRPYTAQNVLATVYRHLGIDLETTVDDLRGRPNYLLDDREPIRELL